MLRRRVADGDPHDVNLHVFSRRHAGATRSTRILGFRDWLRDPRRGPRPVRGGQARPGHAGDWKYVQNYADAKTDVIKEIQAHARPARDASS